MMKVYLGPQMNDEEKIIYSFEGDVVTVTLGDITDTFDFTGVPDGSLELSDPITGEDLIKTNLPIQPIISARKSEGVLYLELLNWIPSDSPPELLHPEWIDSTEYTPPEK